MRILKLRFQNLNSLHGEWEIDFRNSAYADEGIFAITGSTGAGKSTILDAICLALYGATPRLGEITQSKNDLMSRHTGECLSEVIFATNSGQYRCTWSQKRARKQPTGNLQSPKHEIATFIDDDNDGSLIEEKASRTKTQVETITGMDFDRFTRAMLLAQGSFSAFLQASSDERSPILEQITGTAIYSDISKKVHELSRNAEIELKTLTDRLSGMTVLSDEEEQTLTTQKSELLNKLNQIKADITKTEADKVWRQNLNFYTNQVNNLEREKIQLTEQERLFAPQKKQLQRALKALEISADIEKLNYQRDLLSQQLNDLNSFKNQLPNTEQNCQIAANNQTKNKELAEQAENAWQQAQPLFNQVRELDTTFKQKNQQAEELRLQINQFAQQLASNANAVQQYEAQLANDDRLRNSILQSQQQIPNADTLPQTLVSLTQLQENSQELMTQLQSLTSEQQRLQTEYQQSQQQTVALTTQLTQLQNQINAETQTFDSFATQLQQLTQGQSAGGLRQQIDGYWQSQNTLNAMQNDVQTWQTNLQTALQFQNQLNELQIQSTGIAQQIQQAEQQQQSAKQTVELLNRNLILLAKIKDLTQERDKLRQGEPCPLCGATEHPFATHQPYAPDQTEQELAIAKQQLNEIERHLQKLIIAQNTLTSRQQQLTESLQQLNQQNQRLASQIYQASQQLPNSQNMISLVNTLTTFDAKNSDFSLCNHSLQHLATHIENQQSANNQAIANLQSSLAQIETLQTQQQQSQNQLSKLSDNYNKLLHEQTILKNNQQHQVDRINEIDSQKRVIQDKQTHLIDRISKLFAPFTTAEQIFNFDKSQAIEVQLAQHIQTLEQLGQRFHQLEIHLTSVNESIANTQQSLTRLTAEQQNILQNQHHAKGKQHTLTQEIAKLTTQRQSLFGERDVDTEAQALIAAKTQAFQAYQASQKSFNEMFNHKEILVKQIASLTTSTTQLQQSQSQLQAAIKTRLVKLGFVDEGDYQSAILADTEREHLQLLANQIHDNLQRNANLLSESKRNQHQLLDNPRSELTLEQLTYQLAQLQQNLSEQQQQFGAVEQQLISNAELKQNQRQLLENINEQRRQSDEWKALHSLIGSSDGKKFRNFAQGLTFNIMIAHANEQLKKMSDRYLLLADTDQPLMLNVMDNYQGGQIRTSKNLSGGESFIISLSLALGLSNMASHRMQVDSLFLDEGFGTLDEEALDVALDTLTNLQQSGKLIGVISHIQALKDRISSKIEVVPQTGGISKIIGAGITKLS